MGVSVLKSDFIMQDLLSRIYCLEFRSGKLPTQRQLAQEYGVSRSTVQEALHGLEKIGAVRAQQGSGIFVRDKLLQNPLVFNSLTRASYVDIESRMLSLECVPASAEEQRSFQIGPEEKVWHFVRLRIVNHEAEQIERSTLPARIAPELCQKDVEGSIQAFIEASGWRISHFITSYEPVKVTRAGAELLGCRPHAPAMHISNRGILRNGKVFETSSIIALDYSVTYIRPFDRANHRTRLGTSGT